MNNSEKQTNSSPPRFPFNLSWWNRLSIPIKTSIAHSIAGAGAGAATAAVMCPLDVIKTKIQYQPPGPQLKYKGTFNSMIVILKNEGVRGLYQGLGPTMFGYLPTWAFYMFTYTQLKGFFARLSNADENRNAFVHMAAAMTAGVMTTTATNPIWVIKIRFMTQSDSVHYKYKSTLHAFRTILATEGVPALYRGMVASWFGATHVAVQFPVYERLKLILKGGDLNKELSTPAILLASITSKVTASVSTYPHEVIRTHLQTQVVQKKTKNQKLGQPTQDVKPLTFRGVIRRIYLEEGLRGFYKGLGTQMFRTVPANALTLLTYELLLSMFTPWIKPPTAL